MFKKKIKQPEPVVVEEEKPHPFWKHCGHCTKYTISDRKGTTDVCGWGMTDTFAVCEDTGNFVHSCKEWDRCDGYSPKHGCRTCNKAKYCKIGSMNKTYADKKITCTKEDDCSEWVILPEIDAMMKHDEV